MKATCAINLHNVVTVSKAHLGRRVAMLSSERLREICAALGFTLGCTKADKPRFGSLSGKIVYWVLSFCLASRYCLRNACRLAASKSLSNSLQSMAGGFLRARRQHEIHFISALIAPVMHLPGLEVCRDLILYEIAPQKPPSLRYGFPNLFRYCHF